MVEKLEVGKVYKYVSSKNKDFILIFETLEVWERNENFMSIKVLKASREVKFYKAGTTDAIPIKNGAGGWIQTQVTEISIEDLALELVKEW